MALNFKVLATGNGNAIAGDAVYSPHSFDDLVREGKGDGQEDKGQRNPNNGALIHSPWLALQVTSLELYLTAFPPHIIIIVSYVLT